MICCDDETKICTFFKQNNDYIKKFLIFFSEKVMPLAFCYKFGDWDVSDGKTSPYVLVSSCCFFLTKHNRQTSNLAITAGTNGISAASSDA